MDPMIIAFVNVTDLPVLLQLCKCTRCDSMLCSFTTLSPSDTYSILILHLSVLVTQRLVLLPGLQYNTVWFICPPASQFKAMGGQLVQKIWVRPL
jgi:hypothetical protein